MLDESTKHENAGEHADPTGRIPYVAPVASSPVVPEEGPSTTLGAEETAVLDFSDEVSFNTPADTQSLPLEAKIEGGNAAPVRAGGSDQQLPDRSGSMFEHAHLDSAPEVGATSSFDVAPGPVAAINEPSNMTADSDAAKPRKDVESNREVEKDTIANTVELAADTGVASNRTNENDSGADDGEPPQVLCCGRESPEEREIRQNLKS